MPDPKTCSIRGPLTLCDDLPCFVECYKLTYQEKYGEDPPESDIPSNSSKEVET